eukprot:4796328-Alexandrium_andersonii.AAC.1
METHRNCADGPTRPGLQKARSAGRGADAFPAAGLLEEDLALRQPGSDGSLRDGLRAAPEAARGRAGGALGRHM